MENLYLTVSALTKYIKYKFDHDTHLQEVLLEGEISNFKRHSRGHFYFTLKDDKAAISALMFASKASLVKFNPTDGMKVFVKGLVSVYEASGTYSINVSEMKSNGVGDLYLAYEALKKEMGDLGYFDPSHKLPIPRFPSVIGVITSPTGAAIRDIINTTRRRYPLCKIILYPALVQGEDAKNSIASQIKKANCDKLCDVIICGRGGGSIEDLWGFNERIVAEAIYDSKIPIISAVGHEVDFTIADFVADMRAATPTAGAEIATPNLQTLIEMVDGYLNRSNLAINNYFENEKMMLVNLDKRLSNNNPYHKLIDKKKELHDLSHHLQIVFNAIMEMKKHRYLLLNEKLSSLSPTLIMDKGFSIAKVDDKIIRTTEDVKVNDSISISLKKGLIKAKVTEVIK